jgi:hypothetical protein
MQNNICAHLLSYVTGLVNQRLLLQSEYLIAENRILRSHVSGRLRLSDAERSTLPSAKSASGSGEGLWRKWPVLRKRKPSSPGIAV